MTAAPPLDAIAAIAREAGAAIVALARTGMRVRAKADSSPVTDADEEANRIIVARLAALTPGIPVVAEESANADSRPAPRFWLVDPLDGTREFIRGRDEWTVNIALVRGGRPVLGIVGAPARDLWFGGVVGKGAWRSEGDEAGAAIAVRAPPAAGRIAMASRSHGDPRTDSWLADAGAARTIRAGSSLKFCLLAEGAADIYPRFGRTMEWDTAAGDAVLTAAGGTVQDLRGAPLAYGKPGFENPPFVARGG